MGCCYACSKYFFIFLNVLFLICGIALIPVVILVMLDPTVVLRYSQESNDFMIAAGLYITAAVILILLAILGIYSVTKEVKWALVASFSLLLIIVVVEVASGVWAYINRDRLDLFVKDSVKTTVKELYDQNDNTRIAFDTIQQQMHCCGAEKASDWIRQQTITLGGKGVPAMYNIPQSCCVDNLSQEQCVKATTNIKFGSEPDITQVHAQGCYYLIKQQLETILYYIKWIGGAFLALQVVGLLLGLILMFSMNKSNRYKA